MADIKRTYRVPFYLTVEGFVPIDAASYEEATEIFSQRFSSEDSVAALMAEGDEVECELAYAPDESGFEDDDDDSEDEFEDDDPDEDDGESSGPH